jgi:hypothetical protein
MADPNSPWIVGANAEREVIQSDLAFLNAFLEQMAARWPEPDQRVSTLIAKFACYLLARCGSGDNDSIAWIVAEIQGLRDQDKRKHQRRRRSK